MSGLRGAGLVVAWAAGMVVLCVTSLSSGTHGGMDEIRIPSSGARGESLAAASRSRLIALIWVAGDGESPAVMLAASRDGGRTFSPPRQIGTAAGGRATVGILEGDVGRVDETARILAAWPAMQDGQTGIAIASSSDGGGSFSRTFVPAAGLSPGAVVSSLAVGPDGRVHALWLADGSHLWYAHADGGRLSAPRRLDGAVSRCGVTALGVGPDRGVLVFWHRTFGPGDDEFAYLRSATAGETFDPIVRLSHEPWGFRSCPGPSPSLSIDATGALRFVFQITLPGSPPRSSFMTDASPDRRKFRPRTYLHVGAFEDVRWPRVVPDGEGGLSLVWNGVRNDRRYVMIRHSPGAPGRRGGLDADWMRAAPPIVLDHTGRGAAPVVVPTSRAMLAAWITTGDQGTVVATRTLSLDELCGAPNTRAGVRPPS